MRGDASLRKRYKAFCLSCQAESDILSVGILSISERQQPLTRSCNRVVRFTTMLAAYAFASSAKLRGRR